MRRPRLSRVSWIGLGLLLVVGAAAVIGLSRGGPATAGVAPAPVVGHRAPLFSLRDTGGGSVSLEALQGRPVLLDFFATWCVPCAREMPMISSLHRSHAREFTVVAIDKQEPASDVRAFVRDRHLGFDPVIDDDGAVFRRYNVSVQPVSFWIDGSGFVRAVHYGAMSRTYMKAQLDRLRQA